MATRADLPDGAAGARLSPPALRFVLHWGEMGVRWGVNRTVAQIQALLYFHGRPFHAEEIADLLDVARSNVSTSLRELQSWNLVRMVHRLDDRRDYYETATPGTSCASSCASARRASSSPPSRHCANASPIPRSRARTRACRRACARRCT
jgi:hypothetical protein